MRPPALSGSSCPPGRLEPFLEDLGQDRRVGHGQLDPVPRCRPLRIPGGPGPALEDAGAPGAAAPASSRAAGFFVRGEDPKVGQVLTGEQLHRTLRTAADQGGNHAAGGLRGGVLQP